MIWLYDGSWEGLLSGVFEVYAQKDDEAVLQSTETFPGATLFATKTVSTDAVRAARVSRGMARLSLELPEVAYCAFLSEHADREQALLETLRLGFSQNRNPLPQRQLEPVRILSTLSRRVAYEAHRFLGYVRLVHVGGDLYAADIEPDYCILPLMGNHFHNRFGDQRLVIRDVRRRLALVSDRREWFIMSLPEGEPLPALPRDDEMTELWRSYFQAIANPARKNLKLQQAFVPLKYRKHLTEFQ